MATPVKPSPLTWTLRLKHDKQTVFIHADPLAPFAHIKAELLKALRERHPDGELQPGLSIPTDPAQIILARPASKDDYSEGWVRLQGDDELVDDSKGKKKGTASKEESSPKSLGLADGAVLAFRFQKEDSKAKAQASVEGGAEMWDVVQLSWEDLNTVPVGADEKMDDE